MENNYREFWISKDSYGNVVCGMDGDFKVDETFEVIEKRALDDLQAKCDKLADALQRVRPDCLTGVTKLYIDDMLKEYRGNDE